MSFTIQTENREDYILFLASGPVSHDSLIGLAAEIKQICNDAKVTCAMVDCGAMEGALSVGKLYFAVQKFVEVVGPGIKIAYINPPSQWIPTDDEFSRNVAQNRGGQLELFELEAEAIEWLKSNPNLPV